VSEERRAKRRSRRLIPKLAALVAAGALALSLPAAALACCGLPSVCKDTPDKCFHINGTVTGPDGAGLANIGVGAVDLTGVYWDSVNTGGNGDFSMAVPPGTYTIPVGDPASTYASGCYASGVGGSFTNDPGGCTAVTVTKANVDGIDVAMPLYRRISGIVTGRDGTPLAGVGLIAVLPSGRKGGTGLSGSDGRYSLKVAPGTYVINFGDYGSGSTYADGGCYGAGAPGNFTRDQNACTQVTVSASDVTGIDMTLPVAGTPPPTGSPAPTGAFHINGKVTGPDGAPLAAILILVKPLGGEINTASDGTWSAGPLPPGSYIVYVGGPEPTYADGCYATGSPGNFSYDTSGATCTPVVVTTADVNGIDVVLPRAVHIDGTVSGQDGTPLALIPIRAQSDTYNPAPIGTSATGTFSVKVPPGTYTLDVNQTAGKSAPSTAVAGYAYGCYASGSPGNFTTDLNACTPVTVTTADVTGIAIALPLAGSTATVSPSGSVVAGGTVTGTDVTVSPVDPGGGPNPDVSVTFATVSAPGTTSVVAWSGGPAAPSDFAVDGPMYYEISTTATHTGAITVCVRYDPGANPDSSLVRLLHWDSADEPPQWKDVTTSVDEANSRVCGTTTSLSPFVVARRLSAPTPSGFMVGLIIAIVIVIVVVVAAWLLIRRRKSTQPGDSISEPEGNRPL